MSAEIGMNSSEKILDVDALIQRVRGIVRLRMSEAQGTSSASDDAQMQQPVPESSGVCYAGDSGETLLASGAWPSRSPDPDEPSGFDEAFYCGLYADVDKAVSGGTLVSGLEHWLKCGRGEGRLGGRSLEHLTVVLRARVSEVEEAAANISRMPPVPNTPRGRFGGALVRIARRALAWHTERVHFLGDAIAKAQEEQLVETQFLAERCRLNQRALAETQEKLAKLARAGREALEGLKAERASREALEALIEARSKADRINDQRWCAEVAARESIERRLNAEIGAREVLAHRVDALTSHLGETSDQLWIASRYAHQAKAEVSFQQQRVSILIEEVRKRMPEPLTPAQLGLIVAEDAHQFDEFYASFEDAFRGTREDIKERQRVYLPYIRQAGAGTHVNPVLDVGCGRGEWLELLREDSLVARGLDSNLTMLERCRELGLDVEEGDVIQYLRRLPDCSFGAVTGFHIVEHLPFRAMVGLIDETVRVLKPGGLAIFETPNPSNLKVGANTFYTDPTHLRPLPSSMMRFIVEARGLCRVEVLALHPDPEGGSTAEFAPAGLARINEQLYGPRDYGILAWKA